METQMINDKEKEHSTH